MRTIRGRRLRAFTLVELLVVVSIIALLISILLPSLSKARRQAKATVCVANLRTLGQGIALYAIDNNDVLPPGRLPDLGDGVHWRVWIAGGLKYRPTFLAMMGAYLSIPAFAEPSPTMNPADRFGEPGGQQNYVSALFVCPAVSSWTDERNGAYGYNYQFLGNSRLRNTANPSSFKNWPVRQAHVKAPGRCVAVADCMGTAASFAARRDYDNNARDADRYGNEGFNLDPPRVDPVNGEMAGFDDSPQHRTAAHPRHLDASGVLWMDAHATRETLRGLRYEVESDGIIGMNGDNRLFNLSGKDEAWTAAASE
jgi:prepilin-type N-terminal cleavage/methylation domain-containing protein